MKRAHQTPPVNYDHIAGRYDDHRAWERAIPARLVELTRGSRTPPRPAALLELGCGTGNLTRWLRELWPGPVVALDRSRGMLGKARAKSAGGALVRADACAIPFGEGVFAAAAGSFFLHHLDARARGEFWAGLRRVLAPGAGAAFVTAGHARIREMYLGRWFPSAVGIDLARFPDLAALEQEARGAGFSGFEAEEIGRRVPRGGADILDKVRARFISTLDLVPEEEFRRGVARMESQLSRDGHLGDCSWYAVIVHARIG